jgi:hypothetical protein
MHQALKINEILRIIFNYLQGTDHSGNPALAETARCCHSFNLVALDVLWRQLDSITPLLLLLPVRFSGGLGIGRLVCVMFLSAGATILTSLQGLDRNPLPKDWDRFLAYSTRVRELHLHGESRIDSAVIHALAFFRPDTVTPAGEET